MADPQPLDRFTPIANKDGTPTEFFMRLLQNRGALQDEVQQEIDTINATEILGGTGIDGGGPIGDGNITLDANTQEILDEITSTQGSVLYRGASAWGSLAPGTPGHVLHTQGPAADPLWAAGGGGGAVFASLNFAPGSPPTINASTNIASVTRTAAGRYQVTFSTPPANAFYTVTGSGRWNTSAGSTDVPNLGIDRDTGFGQFVNYFDLIFVTANAGAASDNAQFISLVVFTS